MSDGKRARIVKYLTVLQHGSATFFSVFLAVHVSAPAVALIGGSASASNLMLLGREYYQTTLTEPLVVWAPLAVHLGAATIKRAIIGLPKTPSTLGATGWLLATALLPVHVLLHRLNPTHPEPPVLSLGPSQLDFEFVKVGLAVWPVMNWTLYSALVVSMMFHAVEGATTIFRVWRRRRRGTTTPSEPKDRRRRKKSAAIVKNVAASAGISTVLGGLAVIATEPLNVSRVLMSRIEASFMLESMFRRTR